jgi:hypothetical protein
MNDEETSNEISKEEKVVEVENNESKKEENLNEKDKVEINNNVENINKNNKKTKSKAPIIITIVILFLLVLFAIGAFFAWKYIKNNESVGTTWGDTYYAYLKEGMQQEDFASKEKYGFQQNMKDVTLQFIEVQEDENPVMIMNYEENEEKYVNVYHINDDNKVTNISYKEPSEVELLYNIELKEYIWYIHVYKANEDLYIPIYLDDNKLYDENKNNISTNSLDESPIVTEITAEISIGKNDKISVEKLDGTTIEISKYDETFVKPEIDYKPVKIDINNIDLNKLKELIKEVVNNYKKDEELITDSIKKVVDEKLNKTETLKEEIEQARNEIQKKKEEEQKAAEKAKKREEEAKKEAERNKSNSTGKISEEQAKKLAQKIDGTKSTETGFEIGYMLETMIKDKTGQEYYLFRVMWLVEDHWSTIDGIAISTDGKKWKQVDIYHNYAEGETIQEVYKEGTF